MRSVSEKRYFVESEKAIGQSSDGGILDIRGARMLEGSTGVTGDRHLGTVQVYL